MAQDAPRTLRLDSSAIGLPPVARGPLPCWRRGYMARWPSHHVRSLKLASGVRYRHEVPRYGLLAVPGTAMTFAATHLNQQFADAQSAVCSLGGLSGSSAVTSPF